MSPKHPTAVTATEAYRAWRRLKARELGLDENGNPLRASSVPAKDASNEDRESETVTATTIAKLRFT